MQTDANFEPIVALARVVAMDGLLDADRAAQGVDHARERDHQPVAEVLDLLPGVGGRDVSKQAEVNSPQAFGLVIAQFVEQRGRADEIGEQQRHDSAARFRRERPACAGLARRFRGNALAATAQGLGQLARGCRRHDLQLVAQPLA